MKKTTWVMVGLLGIVLGLFGAMISLKYALALLLGLCVISLFFLDYQRVLYVVAFYLILDHGIRQYTSLPKLWGEMLFVFCIILWGYKWWTHRKETAYRWTPMEFPIFLFVGVSVFLLLFNSSHLRIGLEGFRVVVEYIFWFFITVQLLRTPRGARRLSYVLVFVGFLLALDGIYQYITNAPMPANWIDRSELVYGSVRTRVYSIIGSPNILGSLMVLLIPVSVSLVYFEKKLLKKVLFSLIALSMVACLVFTSSRGAWVGFVIAIVVFALIADRKLLIPLFVCSLVVLLFVPSVRDRISYMLSPQYIASSQTGGRLGRAAQGIELLKQNLLMGVGFGRFGGAVAINNKIPNAFYSDNYYLKVVVETGILGLSAFLLMLYNVVAWSLRAIHSLKESPYRYLCQGILSGLCGVMVHCLFENIFEYTAMTVYFWMLVGIIMFLGFTERGKKKDF